MRRRGGRRRGGRNTAHARLPLLRRVGTLTACRCCEPPRRMARSDPCSSSHNRRVGAAFRAATCAGAKRELRLQLLTSANEIIHLADQRFHMVHCLISPHDAIRHFLGEGEHAIRHVRRFNVRLGAGILSRSAEARRGRIIGRGARDSRCGARRRDGREDVGGGGAGHGRGCAEETT